jgi:hypothetical protein
VASTRAVGAQARSVSLEFGPSGVHGGIDAPIDQKMNGEGRNGNALKWPRGSENCCVC